MRFIVLILITNLHSEIVEFEDGTTAHCVYDYDTGIWCR